MVKTVVMVIIQIKAHVSFSGLLVILLPCVSKHLIIDIAYKLVCTPLNWVFKVMVLFEKHFIQSLKTEVNNCLFL